MSQRGARTAPPKWAEAVLSTLLAEEDRESVLGEVRELYEIEYARKGPAAAGRWYVRQVVGFAWQLARHGRRRGVPRERSRFKEGMRGRSELVNALARTIGLALRRVRRAPGFTASVVVILTLGIGVNAVMFGVVDRLLLSPPQHIVDADEVRVLYVRGLSMFTGEITLGQGLSYPDYQDFLAVDAFTDVAAYTRIRQRTVGRGEAASRARVVSATANLFPLLGVKPAVGRFFPLEGDTRVADPIAVLAHEYWERRYGSDPEILGRTIEVDTESLTVIGVAPAGFTGAELAPVDIWLPISEAVTLAGRGALTVRAVARLAPDATVEAAEAEATARHRGGRAELIARDFYNADAEVILAPIIAARGPDPTSEVQVARWLAGVSLVVLLIACFNVANLLLTRTIRTRREIAVRLALGASRGRLIGELLTESLTLAMMGAGVALLVARVFSATVHEILLPNVAFTDVGLGGRLLGFTLVATVATGLITGLIPAFQASKAELADTLKAGGGGVAAGRSKARSALLVGQVALSVVLLVGAGLFVRSLRTAQGIDLGFDPQHIAVVTPELDLGLDFTERAAILESVIDGIRRLPGVRNAGVTTLGPFGGVVSIGSIRVPGLDSIPQGPSGGLGFTKVSWGYFEAMGLTISQGRGFEPADDVDEASPVSVVSENMARAIWPAGDALGGCLIIDIFPGDDSPCTEVVGIVENHRRVVGEDPDFLYFLNQAHPFPIAQQTLVVGTIGEAEALVDLIRDEARAASTQIRFVRVGLMSDIIERGTVSWRRGAQIFTAFGFLALIVAGWGLYSVLAFDVALRQRELGIRSALGATVARLVRSVLGQAVLFVTAGVGIGLLASWAASRFVAPLLFQVSATDPPIYALVGVTLLLVAGLAGSLPAWRATRVDPREALQAD